MINFLCGPRHYAEPRFPQETSHVDVVTQLSVLLGIRFKVLHRADWQLRVHS